MRGTNDNSETSGGVKLQNFKFTSLHRWMGPRSSFLQVIGQDSFAAFFVYQTTTLSAVIFWTQLSEQKGSYSILPGTAWWLTVAQRFTSVIFYGVPDPGSVARYFVFVHAFQCQGFDAIGNISNVYKTRLT